LPSTPATNQISRPPASAALFNALFDPNALARRACARL
jgi:hypothetical protein